MTLIVRVLFVVGARLVLGANDAHAAYRVTFKNGKSIAVQTYEDVGDAIRDPRLGGTVSVPKADVRAIEEAFHHPPPATLASPAPATSPRGPGAGTVPPVKAAASPDPGAAGRLDLPWPVVPVVTLPRPPAGETAVTAGTIRILTVIGLVVALVAAVLFFLPS